MSDYGDEHDAPPSYPEPEVVTLDKPAGAALLFKAGLVSYDIARYIDNEAFVLEENRLHEDPGLNTKVWRSGNKFHREFDQPAVIGKSGRKLYYRRGQLHRNYKKGPALIDPTLKRVEYYHRGRLHNPDGPARITDKVKEYYIHGDLHRIGGPAIEYTNPTENIRNTYFVHGELVGYQENGALIPYNRVRVVPHSSEPPSKKRKKG
jgi:hypothetical protein